MRSSPAHDRSQGGVGAAAPVLKVILETGALGTRPRSPRRRPRHRGRCRFPEDLDRQDRRLGDAGGRARPARGHPGARAAPVGFKASGGIRTLDDAAAYLAIADRDHGSGLGDAQRPSASARAACSTHWSRAGGRGTRRLRQAGTEPCCLRKSSAASATAPTLERRRDRRFIAGALDRRRRPRARPRPSPWRSSFSGMTRGRARRADRRP